MQKDNYHHGQVRDTALKIARQKLIELPVEKLTIRLIAGEIGVTHRALYNHFENKEALLEALALLGFNEFSNALSKTESQSEFIQAYIDFALGNAHLYDLMMSRDNRQTMQSPDLRRAIMKAIDAGRASFLSDKNEADTKVKAIWMTLHGGISLYRNAILVDATEESFAQSMIALVSRIS